MWFYVTFGVLCFIHQSKWHSRWLPMYFDLLPLHPSPNFEPVSALFSLRCCCHLHRLQPILPTFFFFIRATELRTTKNYSYNAWDAFKRQYLGNEWCISLHLMTANVPGTTADKRGNVFGNSQSLFHLFSAFFKRQYKYYTKLLWRYNLLVSSAGIQTHNLSIVATGT